MRDELYQRANISIHALHEESDGQSYRTHRNGTISIHALHEESDCATEAAVVATLFQSTLSMRRATIVDYQP